MTGRDTRDTTSGRLYQHLQRWRVTIVVVIFAAAVIYVAAKFLF
jgi:hypothetical protein